MSGGILPTSLTHTVNRVTTKECLRITMSKRIYPTGLIELKACHNLAGVAGLLAVEPRFLSKEIYHTPDEAKYTIFKISKKNGSSRTIHAPNKNLKFLQSRLSRLLYQCFFDVHGVPEFPQKQLSHGFQKRRNLSIYTNATRHVRRRFVFNADIESFFPSFNFGRVRGYFIKNKHFELDETVATVIAHLSCFNNSLPQGAPSSPIISEFITQTLDFRFQALARKYRCTYSRYADDVTFSTNLAEFPSPIAIQDEKGLWRTGESFERAISSCGFSTNAQKVRMQGEYQRQATTGLTVNDKVNVGAYYYKGVRYCAHAMMTTGKAVAKGKLAIPNPKELNSNQIWGMLCHVNDIKGRELPHKAIRAFKPQPVPAYLNLMRQFYHYRRIHLSEKPLVVCEGKTDYIYLKEAIRWNANDPRVSQHLISSSALPGIKSTKGDHWGVDFVNHSDMAGNLLELAGGGGNLKNFAAYHIERVKKLHVDEKPKPVIIVVDNDNQSKGMWTFIKDVTASTIDIDGSQPFYHVSDNLYVVPIPKGKKQEIYIEQLFDDKWLKTTLDGKAFKEKQKKGEKLGPNEYGKNDFATKVIRANRGAVDCSSFMPLLQAICDVIEM